MTYTFTPGRYGVHSLTASYELLVKAFGDDGLTAIRDDYNVQAQWDFVLGDAEVYDYKSVVPKEQVTDWYVQGTKEGVAAILAKLEAVL